MVDTPELRPVQPGRPADIFDDLDSLKVDQSFIDTGGVKKLLRQVPVRKPKTTDWFRVHPDPAYRQTMSLVEKKDESKVFIVTRKMAIELAGEPTLHNYEVFTAINTRATPFLFAVRLMTPDGKWNSWHRSQHDAAMLAIDEWLRMTSNKDIGGYDLKISPSRRANPDWSVLPSFSELLRIAFRDFKIETADHPYIRRLRDEI
jgi:hypothetical protein